MGETLFWYAYFYKTTIGSTSLLKSFFRLVQIVILVLVYKTIFSMLGSVDHHMKLNQ